MPNGQLGVAEPVEKGEYLRLRYEANGAQKLDPVKVVGVESEVTGGGYVWVAPLGSRTYGGDEWEIDPDGNLTAQANGRDLRRIGEVVDAERIGRVETLADGDLRRAVQHLKAAADRLESAESALLSADPEWHPDEHAFDHKFTSARARLQDTLSEARDEYECRA